MLKEYIEIDGELFSVLNNIFFKEFEISTILRSGEEYEEGVNYEIDD